MTTTISLTGSELAPIPVSERWGGLRNLLGKELGEWWKTKLWWIQTLLWLAIVVGISTIVMADSAGMTATEHLDESILTFFAVGLTAAGIGVVVTVQGAVIGEKDLGTAAWVMSKPVSRASFIFAKVVAHSVGFLVTAVIVPAVAFWFASQSFLPAPIDVGRYAVGVGVYALGIVFYVSMTVALGTMFDGRGPVAGIAIGFILSGQLLKGGIPPAVLTATPWALAEVATSFTLGETAEWNRLVPVVVTAVAITLFAIVSMWRFEREEF